MPRGLTRARGCARLLSLTVATAAALAAMPLSPASPFAPGAVDASGPSPASESYGAGNPSMIAPRACAGDAVNCATGNFTKTYKDLFVPGRGLPLDFERTYNSGAAATSGPFGYGWSFSYGMSLAISPVDGSATVTQENGSTVTFAASNGSFTPPSYVLATLVQNADGTYTFTRRQRSIYTFSAAGALLSERDLNGYVTTMGYDASNRLVTVTEPAGRTIRIAYGANGLVSGVMDDATGMTFGYDAAGELTSVSDQVGNVTAFAYDAAHELVGITDGRSYTTTITYTGGKATQVADPMSARTAWAYGNGATTVTDALGNVTQSSFDSHNLTLSTTRAAGTTLAATWTYTYDPVTLGVASTVDPDGHTTSQAFDANGNRTAVTDALNRTTTFTYDALDDLTRATDALHSSVTTLAYDTHGNLTQVSTPIPELSQVQVTSYAYDPAHAGDLVSVTDPDGYITRYAYDMFGDRTTVTDADGNIWLTGYSNVGWVMTTVPPRGNQVGALQDAYTTHYTHDYAGRLLTITDPLGDITTYAYDADGNRTGVTLPDGARTTYTYDADNRLSGVQRAGGGNLLTTYDQDGNVVRQYDPLGGTTAYTYDALNRLASTTDALGGRALYFYDGAGNHTGTQDATGGAITYGYDAANELTSVSYTDATTPSLAFSYDADGRRATMTVGVTSGYTWVRDSIGRITQVIDGNTRSISYGYDVANRLATITYPATEGVSVNNQPFLTGTVSRAYDNAGRLTKVTDWKGNLNQFGYDADGNVTSIAYGNGTTAAMTYDNAGRELSITDSAPVTGTFLSLPYTYDKDGRVTAANSTGVPAAGLNDTYVRDSAGRLSESNVAPAVPNEPTETWTYNAADEVVQQTVSATTDNLAYNAAGELTGITDATTGATTSLSYDARGNRVKQVAPGGTTTTYGWDATGMLRSYSGPAVNAVTGVAGSGVAQSSYNYDGDGLLTSLAWDRVSGSMPLPVQDVAFTSYIYGPDDMPLEQVTAGGTVSWYHEDRIGSVRALTGAQGAVVNAYSYDPYGRQLTSTTQVANPLGFAGQYTDATNGLIYMRARWYDPSTEQFLSRDPLSAQTREPYAYALDDPVDNTDPTGLRAASAAGSRVTG